MFDGLAILHWFSIIAPLIAAVGAVGMVALMFVAPAAYVVVLRILKGALDGLMSTRPGCAALAMMVAAPLAYWGGVHDQSNRDALRDANAAAALAHRLAGAAQLAANNDRQRAEAAEVRAKQAEDKANALASVVPTTQCFAPADTDRLRRLWPDADKDRPAAGARTAPRVLRRGGGTATGGGAH